MAHEVETMAYAHEVPWHGLGVQVSEDLTTDEMLTAAQLDWRVDKKPLFYVPNNREIGPLPIPDYFGLIRDKDNGSLGICGKEYIPFQNREVMEFFRKFTEAGQMKLETAGSLCKGKKIWVLARIEESFKLDGDDEVRGFLLLMQPHIWGKAAIAKFTTIRVVCANTLAMSLGTGSKGFRMPHIRPFDQTVMHDAEVALKIATEQMKQHGDMARLMASAPMTREQTYAYIASVFQPELIRQAEEVGEFMQVFKRNAKPLTIDPGDFKRNAMFALNAVDTQPGAMLKSSKETFWGALNAVTFTLDHVVGRHRDNALDSAWFGANALLKEKAFDTALAGAKLALAA